MSAARTASLPAASAGAADVRHSADVARALERKPRLEVPCILHVWIATASSFDVSADDEGAGDEAEARHGRRDVRAGETLAPMRVAAKVCVAAMFRSCVRFEVRCDLHRCPLTTTWRSGSPA